MAQRQSAEKEQEIMFTRSVKAGKRIYYLDVKRNLNNDFFITITESKKVVSGTEENPVVNYEKHKLFIYEEDFSKFEGALHDVIDFVEQVKSENNTPEDEGDKNTFHVV